MRLTLRVPPALVLLFLSPIIGEVLSGSTPILSFFTPVVLLLEVGLYGSGAIITRELAFRWKRGVPTILLLGAAYGAIEEGLDTKSWFNPNWPDVGILGTYGRAFGVNWVWAVELTVYHAVFSIAIPILLVGLLFPGKRHESWIGGKGLGALGLVFVADVAIGFFQLLVLTPSGSIWSDDSRSCCLDLDCKVHARPET
jgi:hypothetical protein